MRGYEWNGWHCRISDGEKAAPTAVLILGDEATELLETLAARFPGCCLIGACPPAWNDCCTLAGAGASKERPSLWRRSGRDAFVSYREAAALGADAAPAPAVRTADDAGRLFSGRPDQPVWALPWPALWALRQPFWLAMVSGMDRVCAKWHGGSGRAGLSVVGTERAQQPSSSAQDGGPSHRDYGGNRRQTVGQQPCLLSVE